MGEMNIGGSGIILLHGWATNPNVFVEQSSLFGNGFQVIAPNMYDIASGFSRDAFSIDAVADAILKRVRESGIERLFILGWSFGGIIAARLYGRLSDVTRGVIFSGFSPVFIKGEKNPHGMESSAVNKLIKRLNGSMRDAVDGFIRLMMYGYADTKDFIAMSGIVLDKMNDRMKPLLLSSLDLLCDGDYTDDVRAIKAKTLIIHGTGDRLCKEGAAKDMANLMDNAGIKSIEGGSHLPFFTNSTDFNNILTEFIKDFGQG